MNIERRKHYSRIDNLTVDFTSRLPLGVTLSSSPAATVASASYGVVGDLALGSPTISGNNVLIPVSGGTAGTLSTTGNSNVEYQTKYCIRVTVVRSDSKTDAVNIDLIVYDCVEQTS